MGGIVASLNIIVTAARGEEQQQRDNVAARVTMLARHRAK